MAKLSRIVQKIFGSTGGGSEFAQIGSLAAGSPTYSKDLDTIQNLSQFLRGLFGITASGSEPPRLQDINALYYLVTSQLKYLFQAGVPEYIATEEYYIGSICQVAGVLYTSIAGVDGSPNIGNAVSDVAKWKKTLDINELSGFGTDWISVLSAAMVSGWKAAFQATLAANVAHVMHAGLGTDWQGLLEAAANTAVKNNESASCAGNAATASNAALVNGLSLAAGAAGTYVSYDIGAGGYYVLPAGLYMMAGAGAGTLLFQEKTDTTDWISGIALGPGLYLSDGTNFRIYNSYGGTVPLRYRKLV